jgi:hypothetical protein
VPFWELPYVSQTWCRLVPDCAGKRIALIGDSQHRATTRAKPPRPIPRRLSDQQPRQLARQTSLLRRARIGVCFPAPE